MLKRRILPCLDVKDGRVVKGTNFVGLVDAGDPVECAARYQDEGADELVFLDITATHERRKALTELVERIAEQVFIPFTVGGGVKTVADMRALLLAGADKISINSGAVARPELLSEGANAFGSQCVVLAVDAKRVPNTADDAPRWEVYVQGGRKATGLDALEWIERGVKLGAGEILLTSMDKDGTRDGYDLELLSEASKRVDVPIIASGGCGHLDHLVEALAPGVAHAALAASIFHFGTYTVAQAKQHLADRGIPIRPVPYQARQRVELAQRIAALTWNAQGLIPAIVQEASTGEVLMMAWMNHESLLRTLTTGRTWFWSRSRAALWNKGESSGNIQEVMSVRHDCDGDTLLVEVRQTGVACHEGTRTCFTRTLKPRETGEEAAWTTLGALLSTIQDRRKRLPKGSYTAELFTGGVDRIGKKVIEEAGETVIAAKNVEFGLKGGKDEIIYEVSDLIYHTMVLLEHCDINHTDVLEELKQRFV